MQMIRWVTLALLLVPMLASAQRDFSNVEIKSAPLRGGTHLLTGAGGNIVASAGEDGVFIIDDQFAPLSAKILSALAKLDPRPPRFRHQHALARRSHRRQRGDE